MIYEIYKKSWLIDYLFVNVHGIQEHLKTTEIREIWDNRNNHSWLS
jgi:hypothetical protein